MDILDLTGEERSGFKEVKLTKIRDTMEALGIEFAQVLADEMDTVDASSSGRLQDSIKPQPLVEQGTSLTVPIEAFIYFDYIDKGVDGWAKSKGGKFQFKTKGVDPKGEMVASIKDWMAREGASATNKYKITAREKRGGNILDASTTVAVAMSYAIKRDGIAPKRFTEPAAAKFAGIAEKKLGESLRIDIKNNLLNDN